MTHPGRSGRSRDLLNLPVLGRFLGWRHARTVLQSTLLFLAALILLDGWFGPQLAPRNLAGVLPWVHWRGFIVLALLVAGNLFCMACPFMLPRRLAKRVLPARRHWPAALRSKWLAVGLLFLFFWAYEAFSLWQSPWLTAWVALTYFVAAFVVDGFFRGASFCRYVCPIGQFNFVNSMVSPVEVRVREPAVCEGCRTLDCIRGRYAPEIPAGGTGGPDRGPLRSDVDGRLSLATDAGLPTQGPIPGARTGQPGPVAGVPSDRVGSSGQAFGLEGLVQSGCELSLFQPRKEGNLDCTFCLECIHACPHDNVGLLTRSPLRDLSSDPVRSGVGRLSRRPDLAALSLLLTFGAFLNAFGMVEPVFALQAVFSDALGTPPRALVLLLFFGVGLCVVPAVLLTLAAALSRGLEGGDDTLPIRIGRFAWGLVPLGFGMWTAHYLYHLLIGGLTLVPVVQEYLGELGLPSGNPAWGLGPMVPEGWLFPLQLVLLQGGLLLTLLALLRIARRDGGTKRATVGAFLPWGVLATLLAGAGIWLLLQPMEMRGTFFAV